MDDREKEDITEILMLLIDNSRTSASREGLTARGTNRRKAMSIAMKNLDIDTYKADDLYWSWLKKET